MNRGGISGRVQLGWGLIEGLAYLHVHQIAHRDIKPGNLVCDDAFLLKIIDFDLAIKVEDENSEIDECCGTKVWTAPEMGEEDEPTPMHSPIKADRWSCGRVLLRHIMIGKEDNRLWRFATQLMASDPQRRPSLLPSLLGRRKGTSAPLSDVVNIFVRDGEEVSRPWQGMDEVDGESMNLRVAKKLRLERGDQSQASRPMGELF